jgi:hypothetical protein
MGHVSDLKPLDESQWLGFEEKLISNFWVLLWILIVVGERERFNLSLLSVFYKEMRSIRGG